MLARFRSPPWTETVFWALDLETSGLEPRKDVVLSVGMVPVRSGVVAWGERFYSLTRPCRGRSVSSDAIRVHHIVPGELETAPDIETILPEIRHRLQEGVLLVHYAKLDLRFLEEIHRRLDRPWRRPPVVDTVRLLARYSHRRRQLTPYAEPLPTDLARARRELGLPRHLSHHALYDALATAELFLALRARLELTRLRQLTSR